MGIKPQAILDSLNKRLPLPLKVPNIPTAQNIKDAIIERNPYVAPKEAFERTREAYDTFLDITGIGDQIASEKVGLPGLMEWQRTECELCARLLLVGPLTKVLPKRLKIGQISFELQPISDVLPPGIPAAQRIICWRSNKPECRIDLPLPEPVLPPETENPEEIPVGSMSIKKCKGGYWIALPPNPNIGANLLDLYNYYQYRNWNTNARCEASSTVPEFRGCGRDYPWDLPARFGFAWMPTEWLDRNPFDLEVLFFQGQGIAASNYTIYFKNWVKLGNSWFLADPSDRQGSLTEGSKMRQIQIIEPINQPGNRVTGAFDYYGDIAPGTEPFLEWFPSCPNGDKANEPPQPVPSMNDKGCDCKKIQKDLDLILRILGAKNFPIEAPRRLIQPRKKGDIKLKNFVEVAEFNVRQIDRAVGMLPMTINFEQEDKEKAITIQVESIADALQQLLTFAKENNTIELKEHNKQLADLNIRELYTLAILQKMLVEVNYELNQIQEFLGYKQKDTALEVPFALNPLGIGLDKLDKATPEQLQKIQDEIFKTTKVKVKVKDNVDEKNLQTLLSEILRHANIASAASSIRVGNRGALKTLLEGTEWGMNFYQTKLLQEIKTALGGRTKKQFEKWLEEAERRYTQNQSPVPGDNSEPFQQPAAARFDIDLSELDRGRLGTD